MEDNFNSEFVWMEDDFNSEVIKSVADFCVIFKKEK